MSQLVQKQHFFATTMARFIIELAARGYVVTFGEAWRNREVAEAYKKLGIGISNSLHWDRLAMDLNLRKHGMLLTDSEDYREAGELWESYSTPEHKCAWGGRFKKPDGNHFSVAFGGRR